jgi:hypothetical protein
MRSGWPHTEDGRGNMPASQGQAPFGPEVSWPNGYSETEHPSGGYRYPATRAEQLPALDQGAHPYAAFNGSGYGDDGYTDPGYQGPSAQDAGIAGTRTVRGFVESSHGKQGYPEVGYAASGYPQSPAGAYGQPGYAGSGYAAAGESEAANSSAVRATGNSNGADPYQQPWDYDQPLRYDGDEDSYSVDSYVQSDAYGSQGNDGAVRYQPPAFDPAAYNGSDYSMPGVNGPGYDLSGIIGTNDFEAIGYDEPSYGRLSYDDPRYDDALRYPDSRPRFDETRFDVPKFDDTRLDNLWPAGEDVRREAGPAGYGNEGFGESRTRSESPSAFDRGRGARSAETRYDMKMLAEPGDHTRFDVPVFDETRLDNLGGMPPARGLRASGPVMLAPPPARPRNWAEDTSLDHFADLDLTDEPVPAAFTRTLDRPQRDDDTAARRAVGKRRGRSGDRRQWMALGAIAVVAAGAIGGVLMKYVFAGPSGPTHQVVAPQTVDGYSRSANLEKQLDVAGEAQKVAKASSGQASDVVSAVYQMGNTSGADAANTQMFMFVGGKLAGADPSASIANFEQTYSGATTVSAGSLGGQAACTETHLNGQSASMCVWFDNDTFGTVVSPTMTTAKLASTMDSVRPSLELYAQQ